MGIPRVAPGRVVMPRRTFLKRAGLALLGLRFLPGCADPSKTGDVISGECGELVDPSKQPVIEAYAEGIASETYLEETKVGSDDRLIFPNNSSYIGMFLNEGNPDPARIEQHWCLTGKNLALVKSFWAFARGFDFPAEVARTVEEQGGTLFLALEPWSWEGAADSSFSLAKINAGDFDAQIRQFLQGAADHGKPLIFSFMHEFNGDWYPWAGDPAAFISAWRRVHDIAQEVGAANVHWAWVMNAETVNSPAAGEFYPGNGYVDMVGVDGFNFGNVYEWSSWQSFSDIFRGPYDFLRENYAGKPALISEYATAGSSEGGDQAAWIADALSAMDARAGGSLNFRASNYFNLSKEADFAVYALRRKITHPSQVMSLIAQVRSNPNAFPEDIIPMLF